jgi:hypothetical protein
MEPIDKQTIDKLRAYESSYQEEAWEDFERFRNKKKKRPIVIFWRMAAGIIISTVLSWVVYKINTPKTEQLIVSHVDKNSGSSGILKSGEQTKIITRKPAAPQQIPVSEKMVGNKSIISKTRQEKPQLPPDDENAGKTIITKENGFQPIVLQSHTFKGVLVRNKTPFMAPYPEYDENKTNEKKYKIINLSIAIAGLSNQAENVISQQNFGLRTTTEIALNRKTELSTGIYVGRENLNLHNSSTILVSTLGMPQLNQANYRWLNIEIPLNVRYHLWQKGAVAISTQAGVSMMGAFDQTSRFFYENRRTLVTMSVDSNGELHEVRTEVIEKEIKENVSNAQRLSFGTAVNLAIGVHYPLGKNQISVEPFLKYPIGAFTAEKLHYSSLGIELRYSLLAGKKKN